MFGDLRTRVGDLTGANLEIAKCLGKLEALSLLIANLHMPQLVSKIN